MFDSRKKSRVNCSRRGTLSTRGRANTFHGFLRNHRRLEKKKRIIDARIIDTIFLLVTLAPSKYLKGSLVVSRFNLNPHRFLSLLPPPRYDRRVENCRLFRKGKLVAALPADTVLNRTNSFSLFPIEKLALRNESPSMEIVSFRRFKFLNLAQIRTQEIQSRRESLKASTSPQRQFVLRTFSSPPSRFSLGH